MTFEEAKNELKKVANGKYHSIDYQLTEFESGKIESKCTVYINPRISASDLTWNEALAKLVKKLGKDKIDLSEIPGEELGDGKRWVKCFSCGVYFYEKNWHTPPSCPHCHRSRVD